MNDDICENEVAYERARRKSRLDYFAAAALTGILATDNYREADAARIAFECAEALIQEIDNG